ncbi:MAG TPA: glycosyltransferase family 4 protein [Verrucomicrobiae bacterium]|nr:glycosyltransferase family 4 protein [Verrucomicrobiae bacterium]
MRRPIAELAQILADQGHEVTVVWPMDKKKSEVNQLHFDKLLKGNDSITIVPIWSKEIGAILWNVPTDFRVISKLWKVGRTHDVLQVWAPFYPTPLLPFMMKRVGLMKAKLIGTYDTIPSYSFSMGRITNKLFRTFFALMTKPFLNAANLTTLYSELLVPHAVQAGFKKSKLRVLPTGVHLKVQPKDGDIREEFSIPSDVPIILFIGLINKRKGVFKLLDVAEQLRKEGHAFKLIAVGKGPEQELFNSLIQEKGLSDVFLAPGRRQDVHNFYHAAHAFILPAEGEGLPGVVMEALSYGVPVVASNIPCIPDLVQNGVNGYLVEPSNVPGFAEALSTILKDAGLREKMSVAARENIAEWDWKVRSKEVEKLYTEALS